MQFCASCGEQTAEQPCTECGADPRLDGRYALRELLGQGSHGMTWRADGPTGACAVKVINLGHGLKPDAQRVLDREVAVLRQLSHPRIPALLDDFDTRSGMTRYRCIVQAFIDGPHLLDELKTTRHTPRQAMAIIAEVAEILVYLHGLSPPIIHRDIKPQNLIRRGSDGRLVLIDFGSVRDTLVGTLGGTMSVGTVGYMAPEQITGDVQPASDLYALGALAVHLLTRQPPRLTHDPSDPIRWQRPPGLSEEIAALVDALLLPDPARRPASASAVAQTARRLADSAAPLPAIPEAPPEVTPEVAPTTVARSTAEPPALSMRPLLVLYPVLMALSIVATVASAFEVESIMITGAIGTVLGLTTAVVAANRRQLLGALAALSVPVLSVICFLVIAFFSISTTQASGPMPVVLGVFSIGLIPALIVSTVTAAVHGRRQQRAEALHAPRRPARLHGRTRTTAILGGRREREEIKAIAAQWRAGVVPEEQHTCPFCGTAVRPDNLVRHYDKVHLPEVSRWRRRQHHLL
jgi:hypothetical protein